MAATALAAARMEPELRARAKEVLSHAGVTESQLIRRIYEYIVYLGDVPEFIKTGEYDIALPRPKRDKFDALRSTIENNPFSHLVFPQTSEVDLEEAKLEALEAKFDREEFHA